MGTKTTTVRRRAAIADSIRKAFKDAESGILESLGDAPGGEDDEGSGDTHIHIHAGGDGPGGMSGGDDGAPNPNVPGGEPGPKDITQDDPVEARFAALEASVEEIKQLLAAQNEPAAPAGGEPPAPAPGGEKEEVSAFDALPEEVEEAMKSKTNDSLALETSFKAVLSDAEVLVPGFRLPTFDSKAKRKSTLDAMCQVRRNVLTHLGTTNDGAALLAAVGGDKLDMSKATCVDVASTFRAAAGSRRLLNNSMGTRDANHLPQPTKKAGAITSLADLNKLHASIHATH